MAAGQLTIDGTSYNPLASYTGAGVVATAGVYFAMPPLGILPQAGDEEYEEFQVGFIGVEGTGTRRSRFMRLPIWLDLVIVNTVAGAGSVRKSLLSSAKLKKQNRYTITLPETDSYPGCKCIGLRGIPTQETLGKDYIGIILPLAFEQLSKTN